MLVVLGHIFVFFHFFFVTFRSGQGRVSTPTCPVSTCQWLGIIHALDGEVHCRAALSFCLLFSFLLLSSHTANATFNSSEHPLQCRSLHVCSP